MYGSRNISWLRTIKVSDTQAVGIGFKPRPPDHYNRS